MHKQPILSIIIITHEQHEQFRRCIDSLLALRISYLYEIIISDDSSTDGTFEIAQQYAKYSHHYKNLVRIVALQCNSQSCSPVNNSERSGYNRCNAYSHAQGKYIAFVDGDDYFDSNSHVYDLQIEALEEHPNCSLAMSNYYYQKDGTEETMIVKPSMELQHKEIIPDDVFITNCYFHLNQAFLQRRIQGFNPYSLYGKKWADSIITYHHLQYGPIVYVDACGYVYVQYKTSITGIMESQDRDKEIVFCMCDKNCDGLVDAMSHILMTSITEVSATGKHTGTCSYMTWNSDSEYLHHRLFPNVSRYLGIGTELSFAGLKNLVSCTTWYGGEAFPVSDIKWIDRQYYYELMRYAGLPANQEFMDEVFITSSGYWDAQTRENNYITVEDENCNLFEVVRDFSTRATEQGFVNVISREYMLKDYMVSNHSVFETDSKAIPYISADYARTERNTTLRLLLFMSSGISESSIKKELSPMGIELYSIKEQLWYQIYRCYADVNAVAKYSTMNYRDAVKEVAKMQIEFPDIDSIGIDVITVAEHFNIDKGRYEKIYCIQNKDFLDKYISELKSAGIMAEDEKGNKYYLGSELKNQVFQKYLPGQFFTFGGKYYEMQGLTSDNQVLVRRAADHITDRCSYRQLRNYRLLGFSDSRRMGDSKTIGKISIVKQFADISITTKGYYEMSEYNNFETASKVVFNESSAIPDRHYKNKEILRIDFPEDQPITDNVRYTVTLMMNEIFRTLFAENHPYIAALTDLSFVNEDEKCNPLTYSLTGEAENYRPNSIYIVEDSQLDLGLIIAVERNIIRIFDIINDYIVWHLQELRKSLKAPKEEELIKVTSVTPDGESDEEKPEKKSFFRRLIDKIKAFFKIGKKTDEKPEDKPEV